MTGGANKTVTLSAVLKDATGKPLANKLITFVLGAQTVPGTTDGTGTALFFALAVRSHPLGAYRESMTVEQCSGVPKCSRSLVDQDPIVRKGHLGRRLGPARERLRKDQKSRKVLCEILRNLAGRANDAMLMLMTSTGQLESCSGVGCAEWPYGEELLGAVCRERALDVNNEVHGLLVVDAERTVGINRDHGEVGDRVHRVVAG